MALESFNRKLCGVMIDGQIGADLTVVETQVLMDAGVDLNTEPTLWNAFRRIGPVSRFDHHVRRGDERPTYPERGILYAALDVPTARSSANSPGSIPCSRRPAKYTATRW